MAGSFPLTSVEPVETVRSHYSALKRRDREAVLATLARNVVWEFSGPRTIPFAGRYCGRAEVGRFFAIIRDTVEIEEFDVERLLAEGDTVVALGRERFRVKATGLAWNVEWVQVHTIRDGLIARFREYTDTRRDRGRLPR